LKAAGSGTFVNVGSGAQVLHEDGLAYRGMYAAVKDATLAFTRAAAVEWGKDGIRALLIMPAAEAPMLEGFKRRAPELFAEGLKKMPLGRYGDAEVDVGRAVAWLCSDEAGYLTGSIIPLDGGGQYIH